MSICKMPVNSEAFFEVGNESADPSETINVDDEFESSNQESTGTETEDITNSCWRISDRLKMGTSSESDIKEQCIYLIGKRSSSKMQNETDFPEGKGRRRRRKNSSNNSIHRKIWRPVTADETDFKFSLLPRRRAASPPPSDPETDEHAVSQSDNAEVGEQRPSLIASDASEGWSSAEVDTFVNVSESESSEAGDALSVTCIWLRQEEDSCDRCVGSCRCSSYDGDNYDYEDADTTIDRLKRSEVGAVHRFRQKKKWRVEKARLQVKTKHCRTLSNSVHGVLLFINHRVLKRVEMEVGREPGPLPMKRKDKLNNFTVKNQSQVSCVISTPSPKFLRKGPSTNRDGSEDAQQLLYAVGTTNADSAISADVVSLLLELQHRDLDPNDYDLLLRLDERVQPRTVNDSDLGKLRVTEVTAEDLEVDTVLVCGVCLDPFEVGHLRKHLPCEHSFHEACIDNWLKMSSANCPLDGLSVV